VDQRDGSFCSTVLAGYVQCCIPCLPFEWGVRKGVELSSSNSCVLKLKKSGEKNYRRTKDKQNTQTALNLPTKMKKEKGSRSPNFLHRL
jgi:hypothetical protein